ncbi:uncharacterized protein LOC111402214 [Olea europaea subsp. europaea]|uniref:Uncharacterized protein LOC111402214 n=1 Tax=Olea europaea subsp. europaea TaxID=158383 RepID=A0A8S0UTZ1_OLEEU|nr:uncharacterized protein LOC111402214 [Olea europaea subsp. europaea]
MGSSDYPFSLDGCRDYCDFAHGAWEQKKLDSTMPWIGMYVAAASVVCSLAMAADAFCGFRNKRLWFPCKYFSLNATSLTLLAVTLKLPVDITATFLGTYDKIAWISSPILISTSMGNFMTALGSMNGNEILLNMTALGILIITVIINICIRMIEMQNLDGMDILEEATAATIFMFLSLVIFVSLSLTVPTTRIYLESKYNEMHKIVLDKEKVEWRKFTVDNLRLVVKKYWVMAVTGNPQFVMARCVFSATSGVMSLLIALTLFGAHIRTPIMYKGFRRIDSVYKWSIDWIIVTQAIGVAVGIIAPTFRWFTAASFKSSELGSKSFKDEFKIETYWIQGLVDWRGRSLPIHVPHHKCRKLFQDAKWLILSFCIGVQILIVLVSKLFLLISASCLHHINRLKIFINDAVKIKRRSESGEGTQPDLTQYVLLLEGEAKVPKKILKNICNEVDKLMQKSIRKHPKNVIERLNKSTNFNGVREFDSNEIPRLNSTAEPPNCWSLPVVTLTSIAISLPNIPNDRANQLVRCVGEGLLLLKLIEKSLDRNGALVNIRNAANFVWVEVELYRRWLDKDLHKSSLQGRTSEETLEELSNESKRTVMEFHRDVNDFLMENPLNWPVKIIAANSMYRTSQTILMSLGNYRTNDPGLFDHLSLMIADILAASLTNLPHVITTKCHNNSLKEGEKSIRQGN